ncbi:hypothetical protein DKX38_001637 [Salix brachista]|uniref:Uncharacterized protein n=1 Tax=Salix brachista TaxID=2182728 RepID=A0A5N5P6A1_9ROSI|nr:hypothetical protein DKX38_001637 [Salix brachista]
MRRNLLFSLIQKRFLRTSSSSFTVQFLVNSCGLPQQSALSVSKKFQIDENNLNKHQSVIQFLKSNDFKDTHIAKTIEKWPAVLHSRTEDTLKPKFDFFINNGFAGQLLPQLIVSNPDVLRRHLGSHIKPCFEFLKPFYDSKEEVVEAIRRTPWLLSIALNCDMHLNADFLIKEGLPVDRIAKLMQWQPRVMRQKHDKMVYAATAAKNLGFQPGDRLFVRALAVLVMVSESTWRKRIEVMESMGWSEDEVLCAFKRFPPLLSYSEEKIRGAMDFFYNTMELQRQSLITYPHFVGFSIDKRVRPRYNVMKVLESRKLIEGNWNISTPLTISEEKFLLNYVAKYADKAPDLLQIYCGAGKSIRTHT